MLKALSLKQMIFAGFGLVLALLVALAGMSLRGTTTIGQDFTDYRASALESLLLNRANLGVLTARMEALRYRATPSEELVPQVIASFDHLVDLKSDIEARVTSDERLENLLHLTDLASQYRAAFEEVVAIQTRIDATADATYQHGLAARRAITSLMESLAASGNNAAAYSAARVQQNVLLARYYSERYQISKSDSALQRALSEIELASENANRLPTVALTAQQRGLVSTFEDNWQAFADQSQELSVLIAESQAINANVLDEIGPQLATGFESILDLVLEDQQQIGNSAASGVASASRTTMIIAVVAVLLGGLAAFFIGRMLAGTISGVVSRMTSLAEDNLDIAIEGSERQDELGDMARALLVFQNNGREKLRLQADQEEQARLAEEEKRRSMNEMADNFESNVNGVVSAVSSAAEQMVSLANVLSEAAGRAGERSTAVAAASEEASTNVETVAAASEQMTNSIAEVSERIGESANMTDEAARGAENTTATVAKLSTSAQTIGEVISMISAIAEQTNLLALNATIEAARAGEAGKGFAVVASEVKSLANQTAKATEEISAQITGMQGETDAVVEAINKIGGMIEELNTTSSSIAAAVEEQHSATEEIARNTQQAADGTREVSSNINEVSTAVQETGQAANEVLTASSQLASEAERLRENVADFLQNVRAA